MTNINDFKDINCKYCNNITIFSKKLSYCNCNKLAVFFDKNYGWDIVIFDNANNYRITKFNDEDFANFYMHNAKKIINLAVLDVTPNEALNYIYKYLNLKSFQ